MIVAEINGYPTSEEKLDTGKQRTVQTSADVFYIIKVFGLKVSGCSKMSRHWRDVSIFALIRKDLQFQPNKCSQILIDSHGEGASREQTCRECGSALHHPLFHARRTA